MQLGEKNEHRFTQKSFSPQLKNYSKCSPFFTFLGYYKKKFSIYLFLRGEFAVSSVTLWHHIILYYNIKTGRFIGNRGIGIKQIVDAETDVKVSISKMTVNYEDSEFNKIVLFGPQLKMKNSLAAVVPKLTKLHSTIVTDYLWGRK